LTPALIAGMLSTAAVAQTTNELFDDTVVHQIHLTMDPADWAALQAGYKDDTYYKANFTWNGVALDGIGLKSRGGGSRSPIKPNLTLKFNKYVKGLKLAGLATLTVKANNEDASNLREWMAMKLYRKMGFPAPREAPAQIYLNGQLLGFYFMVEHLKEPFLERNFGESSGYLYSWESYNYYDFENLGTDPEAYAPMLELETDQDKPDLQNFVNLVQAINAPAGASDEDYIRGLKPYLDPKSFLTYAATENVIANSDGMVGGLQAMNNFSLYQFGGSTLYQLIVWDQDFSFSAWDRPILQGSMTGLHINALAKRLIAIPEYKQFYLNQLVKAASILQASEGWAYREVDREYAIIRDAARNDPNKQCMIEGILHPCGAADFEAGVQYLHAFLANRYSFVVGQAFDEGLELIRTGPQIAPGGVSARGGVRQLAPGALGSVRGTDLASEPRAATEGALPRILGSTFVTIDGVRAPLFRSAANEIQFQTPWDVNEGNSGVVVWVDGDTANSDIAIAPTAASIVNVMHGEGGAVNPSNPASAGETLVALVTGLGAVDAVLPSGAAAPANSGIRTDAVPSVSVGGQQAEVSFSGLVSGAIGLYQVRFKAPEGVPAGPARIVLSAGTDTVSRTIAMN
jgi:uncharacterized protein (TIGR03437 family)